MTPFFLPCRVVRSEGRNRLTFARDEISCTPIRRRVLPTIDPGKVSLPFLEFLSVGRCMRRTHFAVWTVALVLAAVVSSRSQSNEQVLHNFMGGTDGSDPLADLLYDPNSGFLFGTTNKGGGSAACTGG